MDISEQHKFFIQICINCSEEIRKHLKVDENLRNVSGFSHPFPRDFYIYQILDEVEKVGTAIIRYQEMLSDTKFLITDRVSRNVLQATIDEQSMRIRKLKEILVETVCFGSSNMDAYYKHYLLVEEYNSCNRRKEDLSSFYGVKHYNLENLINVLDGYIIKVIPQLDLGRVWYVDINKSNVPFKKFNSYRLRLIRNYKSFSKNELIALGLTYGGYADLCSNIHPSLGTIKNTIINDIDKNIGYIGIIAKSILLNCKKLLSIRARKGGLLSKLNRLEAKNKVPHELFNKMTKKKIDIGDYVLISNELGVIDAVMLSKCGFKSYKIDFIDNTATYPIEFDYYPSDLITLLFKWKPIIKQTKKMLGDTKFTRKELRSACNKSVVNIRNNVGLKEFYSGNKQGAKDKLNDEICRLNNMGLNITI